MPPDEKRPALKKKFNLREEECKIEKIMGVYVCTENFMKFKVKPNRAIEILGEIEPHNRNKGECGAPNDGNRNFFFGMSVFARS